MEGTEPTWMKSKYGGFWLHLLFIPLFAGVLYIQTLVGNGISEPATDAETWRKGLGIGFLNHQQYPFISGESKVPAVLVFGDIIVPGFD